VGFDSRAAQASFAKPCQKTSQDVGRGALTTHVPTGLVSADDLEVLVDEDVVRPADADVVNLVLAVAQLDNTVDDAAWVGGQWGLVALFSVVPLTIVPDP
jgi:hypothetical protein